MIYMDNAATSLGNYGLYNVNSPYATEQKVKFENARKRIASIINCKPEELYFTSGGCEANSWVLQRCGCETIITTKIEHPSTLNCCKWLEKHGKQVIYLETNKQGLVNINDLNMKLLSASLTPTLVSIILVNNELGCTQDIDQIKRIIDHHNELRESACKELGVEFTEKIYLHLDAVQAMSTMDIDCSKCDMLSASGHKFGSPTGVGFLYSKVPLEPLIFGGSQEKGIRGGTSNYIGVIRMADMLEAKKSDKHDLSVVKETLAYLREQLGQFDCIINTPEDSTSNILSVSFKGVDAEKLMIFLTDFNVYVSAGSACETDHKEPSHVLKAINVPDEYINGTIRFSLSPSNSIGQIDKVIYLIQSFIGGTNGT